ncbi:hypothetical protein ACHHYP_07761 [Achlya hypogyna]|uniref:Chitin-binding type-4 domain-containing protein n=1 Tax=Achlya hypogyna TaxID=1202772 RepID=A0A1V9ZLI8_ACHHY|nr:hypothetical protein ACHHYP_07761 [Achlya hypogyna]
MKITTFTGFLLAYIATTDAHGRMITPPHRGWMGRLPQFSFVPIDYDDNGLSAGGVAVTSTGPHGMCGDAFMNASPRAHENGGKYGLFGAYGSRAIVACYSPGATVDIQIQITANHMGYFTFGLCKLNAPKDLETESCFQELRQPNGDTKWPLPPGNDYFKMQYTLPKDLTCDGDAHCVLRWWYTGGNNWGQGQVGQEQFWNCADIYISNSSIYTKPNVFDQLPTDNITDSGGHDVGATHDGTRDADAIKRMPRKDQNVFLATYKPGLALQQRRLLKAAVVRLNVLTSRFGCSLCRVTFGFAFAPPNQFVMKAVVSSIIFAAITNHADAHGRMLQPAHRGWMGRLPKFNFVPIDYSDNGLNGGGIAATSSGPHGVCGDPYSQATPREHETGGVYGTFPTYGARAITGCYAPGSTVDIQIQITANHLGYFTFGLCKLSAPKDAETESCFQPLFQTNGTERWTVPPANGFYDMQYKLPSDVTCDGDAHCVLRWVYTGGNNWGADSGQEQFWNCADIYQDVWRTSDDFSLIVAPNSDNRGAHNRVTHNSCANNAVAGDPHSDNDVDAGAIGQVPGKHQYMLYPLVVLTAIAGSVLGHGRMIAPPARGFMGRLDQFSFAPIDYDDDGLNAGGIGATTGGSHGVCGDPTVNERAITSCYAPGSTIDIDIQITANHRGGFFFALCKLNGRSDTETEACFQDLVQPNGNKQWKLPGGNKVFSMQYVLPAGLTCDGDSHCVLRWWYLGGNNPGGPDQQENFWNCADIYISNSCAGTNPFPTPVPTDRPSPDDGSGGYPPAPTTQTSKPTVTPKPTTTVTPTKSQTPTLTPTTAPGGQCDGKRNVCYWPATQQVVPYGQADCAQFSSFIWCS